MRSNFRNIPLNFIQYTLHKSFFEKSVCFNGRKYRSNNLLTYRPIYFAEYNLYLEVNLSHSNSVVKDMTLMISKCGIYLNVSSSTNYQLHRDITVIRFQAALIVLFKSYNMLRITILLLFSQYKNWSSGIDLNNVVFQNNI